MSVRVSMVFLAVSVLVGCKPAEKKCADDKDEKACQSACDAGKAKSCVTLADMKLRSGGKVKKDIPGAYALYKKACKADDNYACARTAYLMGHAGGPAYDNAKYVEIAKDACKQDEQLGCALWASTMSFGSQSEKDKAFDMAKKACDADVVEGCTLYSFWSIERGEKKQKMADKLDELCEAGHEYPCFYNTLVLQYGKSGLDKDPKKAAKISQKWCEEDEVLFCSSLAGMYADGDGVEKNAKKAYKFKKKACDLLDDPKHFYCKDAEKLKAAAGADD